MTLTRLIIARHGNTFLKNEPPRRVGLWTDIALTEAGRDQARASGKYLRQLGLRPDAAFSSHLRRTIETAEIMCLEAGIKDMFIQREDIFNEIDYGPDENQTEDVVISRIGKKAIEKWDDECIPAPGWNVNPERIVSDWHEFAERITKDYAGCTILVVTSNGVARFAPRLIPEHESFKAENKLKLSTGGIAIFRHESDRWNIDQWNVKPIFS